MGRAHWKQSPGDVQGPMLRNVRALEREGLAGRFSQLCLSLLPAASMRAASWAGQGSPLPIPKVGWQTVGHRPWPEATGVLAKRAGSVLLILKKHSHWDGCRPGQLNQAGSKESREKGEWVTATSEG